MVNLGIKKFNNHPNLKTFRRTLRTHLTPAEAKLWGYLSDQKLDGRKFRRQHSIGPFILDFYCPKESLAVELDGQVHLSASARDYDHERDTFLTCFGVLVLRFENKAVFDWPEYVINHIKENFGWRDKNHPGLTATPPSKGGEL